MLDHFKAFAFLNREDEHVEMEPLWPVTGHLGPVLVVLLLFF